MFASDASVATSASTKARCTAYRPLRPLPHSPLCRGCPSSCCFSASCSVDLSFSAPCHALLWRPCQQTYPPRCSSALRLLRCFRPFLPPRPPSFETFSKTEIWASCPPFLLWLQRSRAFLPPVRHERVCFDLSSCLLSCFMSSSATCFTKEIQF